MNDPRHYRERLADEVVFRCRSKLTTMLPDRLNDGELRAILGLVARAVTSAVTELDQREIWRTD
jgi:hypothetical protein